MTTEDGVSDFTQICNLVSCGTLSVRTVGYLVNLGMGDAVRTPAVCLLQGGTESLSFHLPPELLCQGGPSGSLLPPSHQEGHWNRDKGSGLLDLPQQLGLCLLSPTQAVACLISEAVCPYNIHFYPQFIIGIMTMIQ